MVCTFVALLLNITQVFMKKTYDATDRKEYLEGYAMGLNPFLSLKRKMSKAITAGFKSGRID